MDINRKPRNRNMFYLYFEKSDLYALEAESFGEVCQNYINYCIRNECNPNIERIEEVDENEIIKKITLGDVVQNDLDEEINLYRKQEERETGLKRNY